MESRTNQKKMERERERKQRRRDVDEHPLSDKADSSIMPDVPV
jgi:hypothetical protein